MEQFYPPSGQGKLGDAMREALIGGKCLRSFLLLEFYRICGGGNHKKAVAAAAAVEMVHSYSLIHDDLPAMDNSDLRRGKPSCHKQHGSAMAILVGDGLLTLAFEVMAKAGLATQAMGLAQAAGYQGMVEGQLRDLENTSPQFTSPQFTSPQFTSPQFTSLNLQDLLAISKLKTAALFSWACRTGGELANVPEPKANKLAEFGTTFGILFQLADDLKDKEIPPAQAKEHLTLLQSQLADLINAIDPKSSNIKRVVADTLASVPE